MLLRELTIQGKVTAIDIVLVTVNRDCRALLHKMDIIEKYVPLR